MNNKSLHTENSLTIFRIGSCERPASKSDIEAAEKLIESSISDPSLILVVAYPFYCDTIRAAKPDERVIVKIGSDEHPPTHEDVLAFQKKLAEAFATGKKYIVCGHDVEVEIVKFP